MHVYLFAYEACASALDADGWGSEAPYYSASAGEEERTSDVDSDLLYLLRDLLSRSYSAQSLMSRSARSDDTSGVVPMPRVGRADGMLPMARAGRSGGLLPLPRSGRSDGMVPMPRVGRSGGDGGSADGMVPMPRAGRSGGMVPMVRAGRSEGMVPMVRAGRSDGVVPMVRAGRSEGMVPMVRAGRSDGVVPMVRAGRGDSMLPLPRVGRSLTEAHAAAAQSHVRNRRSIPVLVIKGDGSESPANESNADARSDNSHLNEISDSPADEYGLLVMTEDADDEKDGDDSSSTDAKAGGKRLPRQLIPLPRVGKRPDPGIEKRRSPHRVLLLPNQVHLLTPFAGLAASASREDGTDAGYFDDPIDLQLRAMYIPRFGKRSFSPVSILKKGGNKGTFQPRIGRGSFQPRVGRSGEGWLMADDSDYLTLDDLVDIRSVRASAFQPRIGRSTGKSEDSSSASASVSAKN